MFEALKARNRKGRPKYAVIAQPPRLFRAFSAKSLHLISPGPMAQALTFCAFGAGKRSFDTGTQVLGYCQPSAPQSRGLYDRENKYYYHGGDLQGVINRLGYLKDLGVTAIWLTPWYDNYDRLNEIELKEGKPCTGFHGYNPQDFYTVEEHFGTLRKLRELVAAAHRLGIKVIQDEVANHTGPYHPWVGNPPTPTWFNGTRAHPAEPKRRRQLQRMEDDKCKNHV
jgi:hypothetical protein